MEIKIVAISGILLSGLTFSALVLGEESGASAQSAAENVQNVPQAQQPRMRPGPGYPGPKMRSNRGSDMPMMGRGWDRGDMPMMGRRDWDDMPMMGRGWDRGDMPMMGRGWDRGDMPMMGRGWDRGDMPMMNRRDWDDMPMMGRGWDRGDMPMMGGGQRYPRYYGPGQANV